MAREFPYKGVSPETLVWLADEHRKTMRPPTLQEIFDEICFLFDLAEDDVLCSRRNRYHVMYRQLFSYVATKLTKESLRVIGEFLAKNRATPFNHSTILNHRETVTAWIKNEDQEFIGIWRYYKLESKYWRDK